MQPSEIVTVPDKRLRQRSRRVGFIDSDIVDTIEQMSTATLDWEATRNSEVGVALAAVQIGVPERIIIIRSQPEDKQNQDFSVFINPEITKREGEIITEPEGCLSIPDVYGAVPRHTTIKVKAIDIQGQPVRMKISGFLARVFQHEIDHLHGTLFVDKVRNNEFYEILDDGKLQAFPQDKLDGARLLWHR